MFIPGPAFKSILILKGFSATSKSKEGSRGSTLLCFDVQCSTPPLIVMDTLQSVITNVGPCEAPQRLP